MAENLQELPGRLLSVDLDEQNHALLSLCQPVFPIDGSIPPTPGELWWQNAIDPTALGLATKLQLLDATTGDPLRISGLRVVPDLQVALVLHPAVTDNTGAIVEDSSFQIIDYDPANPLGLVSLSRTDLDPAIATCTASGPFGQFLTLSKAEVIETGGERIAFFLTTLRHTGFRGKPVASGIVACNITDTAAPVFYTASTHVYDPVETDFACVPAASPGDRGVIDFTYQKQGNQDLLLLSGGVELQFRALDVTNFDTQGFVPVGGVQAIDFSVSNGAATPGFQGVTSIEADPSLSLAYATSFGATYTLDVSNPASMTFTCELVNLGKGFIGDVLFMLEGSDTAPDRHMHVVPKEQTDYKWKVTDHTNAAARPLVDEVHYSSGGLDGVVAIFPWDAVYAPTYGGLVRWDVAGALPVPGGDPAYQPAIRPSNGSSFATEHVEVGWLAGAPSDKMHVFSQSAQGGFNFWPLEDAAPHNPLPCGYADGVAAGGFPDWPTTAPNDFTFGSDLAFGQDPVTGDDFVILDHYNVPQNTITVGRYVFGPTASPHWDTHLTLSQPGITVPVKDIAIDGAYAFVTAHGGFFVIDLASWTVVETVLTVAPVTPPICGESFTVVEGIARSGDRLFVSMSNKPPQPGSPQPIAIAVYAFDELTGQVTGPLQCLFDGHAGQDDFPGVVVSGGGRLQVRELVDRVRVYSCTQSGHLLELEYHNGLLTPLAYWHNGSFWDELTDCQVYPICGQVEQAAPFVWPPPASPTCDYRILVSKWTEGWATVIPSAFQSQ